MRSASGWTGRCPAIICRSIGRRRKATTSAENLDVDIKEGAGSGKTVALMAGQQDDIGLADYMFMSVGVAKGMKLKGIFGEVQDGAWAIISRADAPIKKPEDLIGSSVATTADHKSMLDLLLAINKIPADKVRSRSPARRLATPCSSTARSTASSAS